MTVGIISLILALVIIVLLVNEYYQERLGVPCMPTMPAVRRAMLELAAEPGAHIVELGSGWGGMTIAAARAYPETRVTGIEFSVFPHLFARLRLLLRPSLKNAAFRRADFFSSSLRGATVILCYLTNPLMAELKEKLVAELPAGARVISSTFLIPEWTPEKTVDVEGLWDTRIYVYRKAA